MEDTRMSDRYRRWNPRRARCLSLRVLSRTLDNGLDLHTCTLNGDGWLDVSLIPTVDDRPDLLNSESLFSRSSLTHRCDSCHQACPTTAMRHILVTHPTLRIPTSSTTTPQQFQRLALLRPRPRPPR